MKTVETQDSKECRNFLAMIGRPSDKETIISFSESEIAAIEAGFQAAHQGAQKYQGYLPCHDIDWAGAPGEYIYCLKNRKKGGKYQILAAVLI